MKQLITVCILFLFANIAVAQNLDVGNTRFIAVTGSAEVIVQPDEIELGFKQLPIKFD